MGSLSREILLVHKDDYVRVRAVPTKHTSTYIFCHAKGQKAADWISIVEPLRNLGIADHIAFVFPYLDSRPTDRSNLQALPEAATLVQKLVTEEIGFGVKADRIAVGGDEDGFETALLAVLNSDTKIAGLIGLTGGLRLGNKLRVFRKSGNAETPVFVIERSQEHRVVGGKKLSETIGQPIGGWIVCNGAAETKVETLLSDQVNYGVTLVCVVTDERTGY